MKSGSPQARSRFFIQTIKTTFHLKEVLNILFLVQFQQFLVCFLVMMTVHLRRFDLGFGVHFLQTNSLSFQVPCCVCCVYTIHPSSFKQKNSTCLLLCVLCVHYALNQKN
jgi:hypothetical protein